jgi:hypothetical protein
MAVCAGIISRVATPVTRPFAINSRVWASSFFETVTERDINRLLVICEVFFVPTQVFLSSSSESDSNSSRVLVMEVA